MKTLQKSPRQRGVTLIELMVGLAIGLLVVAVAMGALMVSRGVSGTVSDASTIQQQGAYVMRVIGQQLRQNGSLRLDTTPPESDSADLRRATVFETDVNAVTGNKFIQEETLKGGNDTVSTGFRRYADNVFMVKGTEATASDAAVAGTDFLARNCVGAPGNSSTDQRVESIFTFDSAKNELRCGGNGTAAQPIAQNVAQFQMTYMVQTSSPAGATVQFKKGSDMPTGATDLQWRQVQGVRVCLVLYGSESIDMPAGSSYTDCGGDAVVMTALTGARKNRMHMLFTSTFQLRSQGLLKNPG